MTEKNIPVILILVMSLLSGCASNECANGKCIDDFNPEYGTSRLIALEPGTGEGRWVVDFPGEAINIRGLQDNDRSVVVVAFDPCFDAPQLTAIALSEDGGIVDVLPPVASSEPLDWCEEVTLDGVTSFEQVSGVCVGRDVHSGEVVAVDPSDNSEIWREQLEAKTMHVFGSVLLITTETMVGDKLRYLVKRISAANGNVQWMYPSEYEMTPFGANGQYAFVVDIRPFALNLNSGDLAWEHIESGWDFVPGQDSGKYLGGTVFVKRQYFKTSDCVDTAATSPQ